MPKKIIWFNWKDIYNPEAGGAEHVTHQYISQLSKRGYEIILISANFKNSDKILNNLNYKIERVGGKFSLYLKAFIHFLLYHNKDTDLIIDQCNALPFFTHFFKANKIFLIQQIARSVWFKQIFFPISLIGYLTEPIILYSYKNYQTFTFANSTKKYLKNIGFKKIEVLNEHQTLRINDSPKIKLGKIPKIIFLSAFRKMKQPHHVLKAFEIVKKTVTNCQLTIIGDGADQYANWVKKLIKNSQYANDILYLGKINDPIVKSKHLRNADFICCTSTLEGWGIIVSEAGSQGTPAIVYDVNGLRDAIDYGNNGYLVKKNSIKNLSKKIIEALEDKNNKYYLLSKNSLEFSKKVDVNYSIDKFVDYIENEK